jgi:hypothetical protein
MQKQQQKKSVSGKGGVTFADIARRAGFSEVATDAEPKLERMLASTTHKALDTVRLVTSTCSQSSSTVKEEHLALLTKLSAVFSSDSAGGKKKAMTGGAAVLPSEYFGVDSGNYYNEVPAGHAPWSDSGLTRTGVFASGAFQGGGAAEGKFDIPHLTKIVKDYNESKSSRVRLSEGARGRLHGIVVKSVIEALKASTSKAGGSNKRLTGSVVEKARQSARVAF